MSEHESSYRAQQFGNGYQFVDGVAMHQQNGDNFHIPPPVIKKHVAVGMFVELRIDSPRFSAQEGAPQKCTCSVCNCESSKPILSHAHPHSLLPVSEQGVQSRGWGEDFWVQIVQRDGDWFTGQVDNPLHEARLHGLRLGDSVCFHSDHILAVHGVHREDLVLGMEPADLKRLAQWLAQQNESGPS